MTDVAAPRAVGAGSARPTALRSKAWCCDGCRSAPARMGFWGPPVHTVADIIELRDTGVYLIVSSVSIPFMKCGGPPIRSFKKHMTA